MGTRSLTGVKSGRSVTLTPHPLLVPWSWKSRAIPLIPYGPYGLYRASVPVQVCTLPYPPPPVSADIDSAGNFTFSVPCIIIQLLQFEATNVHNFIKITLLLQHTSSYMLRALLVLHHGEHNCKKLLFNIFCMQHGCRKLLHDKHFTHWGAAENLSVCNIFHICYTITFRLPHRVAI